MQKQENIVINVDDMKVVLLPPKERYTITEEEATNEIAKFLTIFLKIKQRILAEQEDEED